MSSSKKSDAPPYREISIFIHLVKTLENFGGRVITLSEVARFLNKDTGQLSREMSAISEYYNQPIYTTSRAGVRLTDFGWQLYHCAVSLEQQKERLLTAKSITAGPRPIMRISSPPLLNKYLWPQVIRKLFQPGVPNFSLSFIPHSVVSVNIYSLCLREVDLVVDLDIDPVPNEIVKQPINTNPVSFQPHAVWSKTFQFQKAISKTAQISELVAAVKIATASDVLHKHLADTYGNSLFLVHTQDSDSAVELAVQDDFLALVYAWSDLLRYWEEQRQLNVVPVDFPTAQIKLATYVRQDNNSEPVRTLRQIIEEVLVERITYSHKPTRRERTNQ